MSVMLKDLLTTYKLGWKTSYYQNTYDYKGEEETVQPQGIDDTVKELEVVKDTQDDDDEMCDACAI
jgi:ribonucleoside-diphosphate reductase alpha chain